MTSKIPTPICAASFLLVTAIPANQRNIAPAGDSSEPTAISTADEPKTDVGPPSVTCSGRFFSPTLFLSSAAAPPPAAVKFTGEFFKGHGEFIRLSWAKCS